MYKLIFHLFLVIISLNTFGQRQSRLSVQISHGINGNFFVRSYNEFGGPANKTYFYKKDFIGSITGVNAEYRISPASFVVIDFFKSTNLGKKNYAGNVNGIDIYINDFRLRHLNRIFSAGYGYRINPRKSIWKIDGGLTLIYDVSQTLSFENWDNLISLDENNYKNSNAVQGGVFLGGSWATKIDTKFDLGLQVRGYYLISTESFECLTLSPTLTYHFLKSRRSNQKSQNVN